MTDLVRVLRNATLVLPERTLEGDVLICKGRVRALAPAGQGDGVEIWDLAGRAVMAGFIDTHTHGGWGVDFYEDPPERIVESATRFARAGVTRLLVTLVPGPEAEMLDRIFNAARACRAAPSALVGIHLEGPFLSRDRKGALPEAGIVPYDEKLLKRILDAGGGHLRVMTFAPEAIPADVVGRIQSAGLTLSIGHTNTDADLTQAAIDAGARRATHLCNAMPPLHHRSPGPVVPLVLDPRVRTEVIVDGQHVDDRVLAMILRLKGESGVLAVSDSMPFAGLEPMTGEFAGVTVTSDGVRATLDDGTLAGSVTPLLPALRRLQGALELTPQRISALGARVPAEDLPMTGLGRIATGSPADLVVCDDADEVLATLRGGERADEDSPDAWLPDPIQRVR